MVLAWSVLLLEVSELRFRLLVLFTLLLAAVTFDFATAALRPKVAYLTLIDLYLLPRMHSLPSSPRLSS